MLNEGRGWCTCHNVFGALPSIERIMLIGEHKHTLDDKKRLSLPSKFRKELGKTVVLTKGLDTCLFVYSVKEWQKLDMVG